MAVGYTLAIDPSIVSTGYAVMQMQALKAAGVIKTKTEGADRYREIANDISLLVQRYQPNVLAIETQYFTGIRSNSILKTCEVKGVCRGVFLAFRPKGFIVDISPQEVNSIIGLDKRTKRAEKKKITMEVIQKMYPGLKKLKNDTADAIAIGLASLNHIIP